MLRAIPPNTGPNPAIPAPTRFNIPIVEARKDGGTTSKAAAAWLPLMKPEKNPNATPAKRVAYKLLLLPIRKMLGAAARKAMNMIQNLADLTRE